MAELARNHHDTLQNEGIDPDMSNEEFTEKLNDILRHIPENQRLPDPERTTPNWNVTEDQVHKALQIAKNGSATGLDRCPYELWKALQQRHNKLRHSNKPSFDLIKALTYLFRDIQTHGIDERTDFNTGWMCPLFKKKDPTEISNYRPITLLNTDYKLLTKVLAIQLMNHVKRLIHPDQAGFIPDRSIFDHIRLAKAILNYAEATEEDGAILALDQEKAYDKIRHDYLWKTMEAFNLPPPFINTVKILYSNARTQVAINGVLSEPFQVKWGIRQGDPLSCPLFDLAIEPLACQIRADPNIKGIRIPGLENPIKIQLFADDTGLFLSKSDRLDYIQNLLNRWCQVSGAKFNVDKTEIIPMGTVDYRESVTITRKINQEDESPLPERIRIACDEETVRILGAWIGNDANDATPWEPILNTIKAKLDKWGKAHPTLNGKRLIVQSIVGGHTQFLTKAQGMPPPIEKALSKMISDFIWGQDANPRIAAQILQRPIDEGGLNMLDIKARNEAIEIMWLKTYLDFSTSRQPWAIATDHVILASAPSHTVEAARENPFLQAWNVPLKGIRAEKLNNDIMRMIKVAKKYNTNLSAIKFTPQILAQLPAWYHLSAESHPLNRAPVRCLMNKHQVTEVADLVRTSARIRHPLQHPTHRPNPGCTCRTCAEDRNRGCTNPHECATEALTRLNLIPPIHNPTKQEPPDGLSLTKSGRSRNENARQNKGEILFDPTITCKKNIAECIRIFTNPARTANRPAKRYKHHSQIPRCREVIVYTDGACLNNGKKNAKCGSGVWFGERNPKNLAIRIPGETQSNQIGELAAIIAAANATEPYQPLKIITDSEYVIEGLTTHLENWENEGWIGIKNANLFRKAAHLLRMRSARTIFQWTKGHNGTIGNKESDRLAKQGASKPDPDPLNLEIPMEFDTQGAKLAALTQAKAYRGILERINPEPRQTTERNLQLTRDSITRLMGDTETDATLWRNLRKSSIRPLIQQFLYKAMHGIYMVGPYWRHITGHEDRGTCTTCDTLDSMEHILTQCREPTAHLIWSYARKLWPHDNIPWPTINLGTILGCGSITLKSENRPEDTHGRHENKTLKGPTRLLQIILSESAYLIWTLRCERVIQGNLCRTNDIVYLGKQANECRARRNV